VALYYFIWQVPHFWLLVMLFHGDYKDGEHLSREQELNEQLQTAIGFANKGHYYVAEDQLKVIANEPRNKTSLRQQA